MDAIMNENRQKEKREKDTFFENLRIKQIPVNFIVHIVKNQKRKIAQINKMPQLVSF